MGFDSNGVKFLLAARASGVDFTRTAMLGRQGLHLRPALLARRLAQFGLAHDAAEVERLLGEAAGYAEPLLRRLGAETVTSVDASPYEGAVRVHDMNVPIGADLAEAFTAVIDGGTLEHVFDFPTAIRNCMRMVAVGGHFLGVTPANNQMGHGFYQFSPELYYRVFSRENGYEVERLVLCEWGDDARWFRVRDPLAIGRRVTLVNAQPAYLLVQARRIERVAPLATPPQQSDYRPLWDAGAPKGDSASSRARALLARPLRAARARVPERLKDAWRVAQAAANSFRRLDAEAFEEVRAADLLAGR